MNETTLGVFNVFMVDYFFCLAFSSFQASLVVVFVFKLFWSILRECADQAFQQAVFVMDHVVHVLNAKQNRCRTYYRTQCQLMLVHSVLQASLSPKIILPQKVALLGALLFPVPLRVIFSRDGVALSC